MTKKKETHSESGEKTLQTLCTQQKYKNIASKSNLFPSKVGGINYSLEEHIILLLSADYSKTLGN